MTHGDNAFIAVGWLGTILVDGDALPDLNGAVRVWHGYPVSYSSSIQTAYDNATSGDTIQITALQFNGDLTFDAPITVTMDGGYDFQFTGNPSSTTINGSLTITDGSVTANNIVIR